MKKAILLGLLIIFLVGCDKGPCGNLVDDEKNSCFLDLATANNTMSFCDKITSDSMKDLCIQTIALNTEDFELCTKINEIAIEGQCQKQLAVDAMDRELCSKTMDDMWKDYCYQDISMIEIDFEGCDDIVDGSTKVKCQYNVSIGSREAKYCEDILDIPLQNNCYNWYAYYTLDVEWCHKFGGHEVDKDVCYKKLARYNTNVSICDFMSIKTIQSDCYDMFEDGELTPRQVEIKEKQLKYYKD